MDTPSLRFEFIFILLLVLANAFFALAEKSVVASKKNILEDYADDETPGAKEALEIAEEPETILSALQIGLTLTGLFTGITAGLRVSPILSTYLLKIPPIAAYAEIAALFIVSIAIAYIVLVIGEFIPKNIALGNPEKILCRLAISLQRTEKILHPLILMLNISMRFGLLFFGMNPNKEKGVTAEEVRTLIEQGTENGTFEKTEQDMVDNIFHLSDQNAYALMTPRTQMIWLDIEDSLEKNLEIINENPETVFPVARDSLDEFVGMLHAKDLLKLSLAGEEIDLKKCIHTPVFIPKSMQSFRVLEQFRDSGIHEAIVLDEFGGVVGLITMRDIIGEVVGDICTTDEEPEPVHITKRDDGSWLIDGLLPIDDFKEHFDIDEMPDEERDHFQTMGGFVTSYLDYIPTESESFIWNDFKFEIVDMDRARVDKILLTKLPKETEKSDDNSTETIAS